MTLYWQSFKKVLNSLLNRPLWLMLLVSLCLMSLVYINQTVRNLPIAIIDQDHSTASRHFIHELNSSSKIAVFIYDNLFDAMHDIDERKIFAAMIVPLDFEKHLLHNQKITILAYGDASNRLANSLIQTDILNTYQSILRYYQYHIMYLNGFTQQQIDMVFNPIYGKTIPLFNAGMTFAAMTFPGLLIMLFQHSLMLASTRINITLNTLPQGKPPRAVFLGSLSALLPIWLFLSIVLFVLWPWILGYRQLAPIPIILILMFPFLFAILGLSKLLTECIGRVEMVYLTLSFLTTPIFYLSGTVWSLDSMPLWVQFISHLLPSTWAVKMIVGVNQMGLSIIDVSFDILMLLVLGCIYIGAGIFIARIRSGQIRQLVKKKPNIK
ncbi:MAG: ABC transporter permease [Candidatus Schmidhempelia sp.]|nr:ABC transporter permease [Candidatus Schmidhempelia sp.]